MLDWNFIISVDGIDPEADDFEDRFFEAGCDDATISLSRGVVSLEFDREAKTLQAALTSAMKDVEHTGARIFRVEPDTLVNMSDIAARTNITRQAVSLYVKGKRGRNPFPHPAVKVSTDSPLWKWLDVARWFVDSEGRTDLRAKVDEALVFEKVNKTLNAGV